MVIIRTGSGVISTVVNKLLPFYRICVLLSVAVTASMLALCTPFLFVSRLLF